jgi:hypothetical protein
MRQRTPFFKRAEKDRSGFAKKLGEQQVVSGTPDENEVGGKGVDFATETTWQEGAAADRGRTVLTVREKGGRSGAIVQK